MDSTDTNLVYSLFTWLGRLGRIRFVVVSILLLIVMSPFVFFNVSISMQSIIMPIISWIWLMQYIKRGHDFGAPAWMSLIVFFASVFLIPALYWAIMPGDDTYNKYGVPR